MTIDQQYWRTPDGHVWTRMPPAYSFFADHLEYFNEVEVLARTEPAGEPPEGSRPASGPGVSWLPVPRYAGLGSFLRQAPRVLGAIRQGRVEPGVLLLRGPSHLANLVYWRSLGLPFAVEVLGDPEALYRTEAAHRAWFTANLRRQCAIALAAGFVSAELERKYPSPNPHRLLDIELPPEAFSTEPREHPGIPPFHVVSVGGFDHPVKGHDVLIRAAAIVPDLFVTIVGGGCLRTQLESLAERSRARVKFAGQLGGAAAVREVLQTADLFVLASRTEGMPRALLEAMALGIPSVATHVGGIPELLPPEQLVPPGDPGRLAATISATLADPERYKRISSIGLRVASAYSLAELTRKRRRFLQEIREGADVRLRGRQVYAC
jgi:glycosyltransferase involved in cell wall biosynthesis